MDPLLQYAINRITELEVLLLPNIPETVWPAEVELIYSQTKRVECLPVYHQHRLKHHINRMWLEQTPVPSILIAAGSLVSAMEERS